MIRSFVTFLILLAGLCAPARGVVLYRSATRNTSAPTGSLAGSGWQWQGRFDGFLGTAIAPSYFVTAEHIGGAVGDSFTIGGKIYRTVATYNDPQSDLQIWKVSGTFKNYAPLYTGTSEVGKGVAIFGRGTQRGSLITVDGQNKGWLWGTSDEAPSWGTNLISGYTSGRSDQSTGSKLTTRGRIAWTFDRKGQANESTLSDGDSGGGVFIRDGNLWKLTGINNATQAQFARPNSQTVEFGSLFDQGGLETPGGMITDTAADIPAASYATRISPRISWINEVLAGHAQQGLPDTSNGIPEPATIRFLAPLILLRRRRD